MNRRGFLGGLLAAPAIVRAESLMKIWVPPKEIVVWKAAQPGLSSRNLAKNRMFAHNYGVQGEMSRIIFPAYVEQAIEAALNDNLLRVNFPAGALTIEYE